MDLAHCSTSAGMPSPPGALPRARESMALLSYSSGGGVSSSSITDRLGMLLRAASLTTLSLKYRS